MRKFGRKLLQRADCECRYFPRLFALQNGAAFSDDFGSLRFQSCHAHGTWYLFQICKLPSVSSYVVTISGDGLKIQNLIDLKQVGATGGASMKRPGFGPMMRSTSSSDAKGHISGPRPLPTSHSRPLSSARKIPSSK